MKYELLTLLPLTGTDEELKALATKVEEKIKDAGGTVVASTPYLKGRLVYPVRKVRQGYYHTSQFEMEPKAIQEFRRALLLSGDTLRFSISKVEGEFKAFIPSIPKAVPQRAWTSRVPVPGASITPPAAAPSPLSQEKVQPSSQPKVTMEEIDKRLEEILGE